MNDAAEQSSKGGPPEDLRAEITNVASRENFHYIAEIVNDVPFEFPAGTRNWLLAATAGANHSFVARGLFSWTDTLLASQQTYYESKATATADEMTALRNDATVATQSAAQAQLLLQGATDFTAKLQTQLKTLQDLYNDLQAQHAIRGGQLLAAQQAQQALAAPAFATTSGRKALMKDPARFAGEEKEARKRHDAFADWKTKIQLRWSQDTQDFPTEFSRIVHAAGLLQGRAAQGIQTNLVTLLEHKDNPSAWPWATGDAFLRDLTAQYDTVDHRADARQRLHNLTQSGDFTSYADFINEFTQLANRAQWDNSMRIHHLQQKVNRKMRDAIGVQAEVPADDDLGEWLKLLRNLATRKEQEAFAQSIAKNHNNHSNSGGNSNSGRGGNGSHAPASASVDPDAMDLSRISLEERSRRIANNLCMYCGAADHYRTNCPTAPPPGQRGGRGGRGTAGGRGGRGARGGRGGIQPHQYHQHPQGLQSMQFTDPYATQYQPPYPTNLRHIGFQGPAFHFMPSPASTTGHPTPSSSERAPTPAAEGRVLGEVHGDDEYFRSQAFQQQPFSDSGNGEPSH
jgi:hypothetical protein